MAVKAWRKESALEILYRDWMAITPALPPAISLQRYHVRYDYDLVPCWPAGAVSKRGRWWLYVLFFDWPLPAAGRRAGFGKGPTSVADDHLGVAIVTNLTLEQNPDDANVGSAFQRMGGKAVAKRMHRHPFLDAGRIARRTAG